VKQLNQSSRSRIATAKNEKNMTRRHTKGRLVDLDIARVITIIWMIFGHVLYETLDKQAFSPIAIKRWYYFRGFTSVIFLVLSGLSFSIATQKTWQAYRPWLSTQTKRRCRRFVYFLLIGYLLQFDPVTLPGGRTPNTDALNRLLAFNILHTIGLSLLLLQLMTRFCRSYRQLSVLIVILSCAIVGFAPHVNSDIHLPAFLRSMLSKSTHTIFPLFPTAAYLFIGAVLGDIIIANDLNRLRRLRLALIAITTFVIGYAMRYLGWWCYDPNIPSSAMPAYVIEHLGGALLFLFGISAVSRMIGTYSRSTWIRSISQESLSAYVFHLVLLYTPFGMLGPISAIARQVSVENRSLGLGGSLIIASVICAATLGFTLLWRQVFHASHHLRRRIWFAWFAYIVASSIMSR